MFSKKDLHKFTPKVLGTYEAPASGLCGVANATSFRNIEVGRVWGSWGHGVWDGGVLGEAKGGSLNTGTPKLH